MVTRRIMRSIYNHIFFFLWRCGPTWAMASSFLSFIDHTQGRTTVGRSLLDERSARRRDLYLTTHNTHTRQTSVSSGSRTNNLSRRAVADPRCRPLGHWDWPFITILSNKNCHFIYRLYVAHNESIFYTILLDKTYDIHRSTIQHTAILAWKISVYTRTLLIRHLSSPLHSDSFACSQAGRRM
jgi:hypothetical protein